MKVNCQVSIVKCSVKPHGFTLIEILVALAIITILASVSFIAVNNTLDRGRDTKRKQDLAKVKDTLNLFFEENGKYPPQTTDGQPFTTTSETDNWIPEVAPAYIKKLPKDPKQSGFVSRLAKLLPEFGVWQPAKPQVAGAVTKTITLSPLGGTFYTYPQVSLPPSTNVTAEINFGASVTGGTGEPIINVCFQPDTAVGGECLALNLRNTNWEAPPCCSVAFSGLDWASFKTPAVTLSNGNPLVGMTWSEPQLKINYQPKVDLQLTANPTFGVVPLIANLTANVAGTETGSLNYYFWWNCDNDKTKIADVKNTCGDPADPAIGTQFLGVFVETQSLVHTYDTAGTYSAKVLVERGSQAVEKRTTVTANAVPATVCQGGSLCLAITPDFTGGATQVLTIGGLSYNRGEFQVGAAWAMFPNAVVWRGFARFPLNNLPSDVQITKVELEVNGLNCTFPKMTVAPYGSGNGIQDPKKDYDDAVATGNFQLLFHYTGSSSPAYVNGQSPCGLQKFDITSLSASNLSAANLIKLAKSANRFSLAFNEDDTRTGPWPLPSQASAFFTKETTKLIIHFGPTPTPTPVPTPAPPTPTPAPVPTPAPTPPPPSPSPGPGGLPPPSTTCENKTGVYCLIVAPDRSTYTLWGHLENANDPQIYNKPASPCFGETPPDPYYNYCLKPD